ncbi:MipA/OmpV family protein [Limnohabitans radicicola]|uniref:Structural protein MipA n=1 Tax=Limnohabitans radicicola TaxID=2771427 RepID=A0A927IKU6_9BURK|nr:MipA/OmpV family protein [Limnohabitans radicicola]MBD8049521.1 hypothetical protein [Limnohabitans radicicola]
MHTVRSASVLCIAWCCTWGITGVAWAQDKAIQPPTEAPAPTWNYSLGLRWHADDLRHPGLRFGPMLGLQYGRWRLGPVDGENWHRFGQVQQDNSLTYDWLRIHNLRTSLSASIQNLERDSSLDSVRSGKKTLQAKASMDYFLPNRWSIGMIVTHDMLDKGGGTALSPNWTYREPLSDNATLLFSQSITWGTASYWQTRQQRAPDLPAHQGAGLGHWDTSLTYRYRFQPHWVFFSQAGMGRAIRPVLAAELSPTFIYSAQLGVIYFSR